MKGIGIGTGEYWVLYDISLDVQKEISLIKRQKNS